MTADVVKPPDHLVTTPHQDDRMGPNRHREIGPRLRQFGLEPEHQPAAAEYRGDIEIVEVRIPVEGLRQRVTRLHAPQQIEYSVTVVHAATPELTAERPADPGRRLTIGPRPPLIRIRVNVAGRGRVQAAGTRRKRASSAL